MENEWFSLPLRENGIVCCKSRPLGEDATWPKPYPKATTAALRPNPPAFFYPGGLSTSSTPAQALPVCVSPGLAKLDFVSRGLASISYLGEGSFAKVYKVDRADEKTVTAFKVFGEKGGSWQAEFLDEWELLEALSTGCWCLSGDWCVSLCASPGWRSRSTSYGT